LIFVCAFIKSVQTIADIVIVFFIKSLLLNNKDIQMNSKDLLKNKKLFKKSFCHAEFISASVLESETSSD